MIILCDDIRSPNFFLPTSARTESNAKKKIACLANLSRWWLACCLLSISTVLAGCRDKPVLEQNLNADRLISASQTTKAELFKDAHFWIKARVNGIEAQFLIDTGATTTVITSNLADAAGLFPKSEDLTRVETVDGQMTAYRMPMHTIEVGGVVRSQQEAIIVRSNKVNLLGMNFLSSLDSWRFEGGELILVN